jgi:hypothetical protein
MKSFMNPAANASRERHTPLSWYSGQVAVDYTIDEDQRWATSLKVLRQRIQRYGEHALNHVSTCCATHSPGSYRD